MRDMPDEREPASIGRRRRRAAEVRALRDALFAAVLFGAVVLINGLLAILLIAWWQAIGWWETAVVLDLTQGQRLELGALRVDPHRGG